MNVPSSTSSSDIYLTSRPISPGPWLCSVVAAAICWLFFVGAMEWRLASRGFKATVIDSDQLWLKQRQRASDLGSRALIVIGASRVQLDLDLDILKEHTGLTPVQLAVDGSSFIPILDGLAKDPKVSGTILVEYHDSSINTGAGNPRPQQLESAWEIRAVSHHLPDFETSEAVLGDALHYHMRSYADGARPITSLVSRLINIAATPQYLTTLPSRARLADYRRVSMPGFYYARVMRNLGQDVPTEGMTWSDLDVELRRRIEALAPAEKLSFDANSRHVAGLVKATEARGGRVIFVFMPRSGLILLTDQRVYPRAQFWDQFTAIVGGSSIYFQDVPELQRFVCPDGSHLDFRDVPAFTSAFVKKLNLVDRVQQP